MYYYFTAEYLSALKINGIFKAKLDKDSPPFIINSNELAGGVYGKDILVEVCPLNSRDFPVSFLLNQDFLDNPTPPVTIVDLKGGYFIKFACLCRLSTFGVITQQKYPFAVATVFKENGLKLSIETPTDFYAESFSFECDNAQIFDFSISNKRLIALSFKDNDTLNCYLLDNKIVKVFSRQVQSFSFDNGLCTTEILQDISGHKIVCTWALQNDRLIIDKKEISHIKDFCIDTAPEHILGYAFLEEFMCGGKIDDFLCDNIKQNAKYLNNYFSNFIGVFPPPSFRDFNEIGLLYKKSDSKYFAEYYTFEMQNKKIANLKRSEN